MPKKSDVVAVKQVSSEIKDGRRVFTLEVTMPEKDFTNIEPLVNRKFLERFETHIKEATLNYIQLSEDTWKTLEDLRKPKEEPTGKPKTARKSDDSGKSSQSESRKSLPFDTSDRKSS